MKKLFLFIAFMGIIFSTCNNSVLFYAPAIYGNTGSVLGVNMSLIEGNGEIFIGVDPLVGTETQNSLKTAFNLANFYSSNNENCSVLIRFDSKNTDFVDGPSAGVITSVYIYSLLENKPVKEGLMFTGGIDENGIIFPVGGIYEKTIASAKEGYTHIIVPELSVPEKIFLSKLKDSYNISVIEEDNFSGVLEFAIYNKTKNETIFNLKIDKEIQIEDYPFKSTTPDMFSFVIDDMLEIQKKELNALNVPDGFSSLKEYYESVEKNTKILKEKGYSFSSANMAFLDYVSISSISQINNMDINSRKNKVALLLENQTYPEKTTGNFEWIASAKLREYWARYQLENNYADEGLLEEEKFYILKEIIYADAWYHISESLIKIAINTSDGNVFDESLLKSHAKVLLDEVLNFENNSALERHIYTSEKLYNDGEYSSSIFSSLYIIHLENGACNNFSEELIQNAVSNYSSKEPKSYWGKIYHTQGYYLMLQGNLKESCNLFSYSFALDDATESILMIQSKRKANPFYDIIFFLKEKLGII